MQPLLTPHPLAPRRWLVAALCIAACSTPAAAPDVPVLPDVATAPDVAPDAADAALAPDVYVARSVTATVRAVADNVVTAVVDARVAGADGVVVRFGDTASYGHETPRFPVGADGAVSVPILGLTPAATTHVRVEALAAGATVAQTDDLTVTMGPAPTPYPVFTVPTSVAPREGYLLVSGIFALDEPGLAMIVDRTGRVMWYRRTSPVVMRGADFQRQPGGTLTLYDGTANEFEELDLASTVLHRWRPADALGVDGHDLRFLPDQTAVLVADMPAPGGLRDDAGAPLGVESVVTVDRAGRAITAWPTSPVGPMAALHPNSLEPLPGGDVLVSYRNVDTVVRHDGATGAIRWRLGGAQSDFRFVGDPLGGFTKQHTARMLSADEILVFDNGNGHAPPVSRAVAYRLDVGAHTATMVWEQRHVPDAFVTLAGSAQRLPNGNTVIGWSVAGTITEVDPAGRLLWEMTLPDAIFYRALYVPTLYP